MSKAIVYHDKRQNAGLGLPTTPAVKAAFQCVARGTHLPFQRRRPDGGLDYILVRSSPRVRRLLHAIKRGVFA